MTTIVNLREHIWPMNCIRARKKNKVSLTPIQLCAEIGEADNARNQYIARKNCDICCRNTKNRYTPIHTQTHALTQTETETYTQAQNKRS